MCGDICIVNIKFAVADRGVLLSVWFSVFLFFFPKGLLTRRAYIEFRNDINKLETGSNRTLRASWLNIKIFYADNFIKDKTSTFNFFLVYSF